MTIKAECILKRYLKDDKTVTQKMLEIALRVCKKRIMPMDEFISNVKNQIPVNDKEWEVLGSDEVTFNQIVQKK